MAKMTQQKKKQHKKNSSDNPLEDPEIKQKYTVYNREQNIKVKCKFLWKLE